MQLKINIPVLFRRLLFSYLLAATIEYLLLPNDYKNLTDLDGLAQMSLLRLLVMAVISFVILTVVRIKDKLERLGILITAGVLCVFSLIYSFTWSFLAFSLVILLILIIYFCYGRNTEESTIIKTTEKRIWLWLTVAATGLFFVFVSVWTVCKVYSFGTPTYDFGIFSQMFYNMKTIGLPITTVERDGPLSHFAVHVSPIYYLLLPFYYIIPTPATLQVLQAAVMASAVIPLWLLGKRHGLNNALRFLLCGLLLFHPAYSGGASFDIHENAFLTPLLLWLLYGMDSKNYWMAVIAALLTLMIKEDAAVYVAVLGVYWIVQALLDYDTKKLRWGSSIFILSLLWFFAVTRYLSTQGDGVMTWRYNNFMYHDSQSLITVIQSVILSPMKVVFECADIEKLPYIASTMLPLLCLPLITRRYERYILLIPYILVNLMPDYVYQHSIFFQYNFGSLALLIYLCLVNLADIPKKRLKGIILIMAMTISTYSFGITDIPKARNYIERSWEHKAHYQQIRELLSLIPDKASVTATTYYTTELSQREILYDMHYSSLEHILGTEYIVLSTKESYEKYAVNGENGYENFISILQNNNYELWKTFEDEIVIYKTSL